MTLLEPPDDNNDLFAQLEQQFDNTDQIVQDVLDLTTITDKELVERHSDVRQQLLDRGEMMDPATEEARELHSQRAAILIEMRRRNLR